MEETHVMEIGERRTADIVTLSLSGKLDTTSAKAFEEKILGQIESGERRIVIDLAQLDYVSSSGLRVFLLASKRLSSANGKIALCSLKDQVKEVFDIAGFSSIFSIYGSPDEALDDYAVMLCGQLRFISDLARQFRGLGVPRDRIITEELEFR
jgi:anti-sigma B factor antagonist